MPAMPKTMATNGEGSKPQSSTKVSSRSWEGLNPPLSEWVLDAVASMGFDRMTPVQASTIPLFMGNKDVVVEAVTGSGKTLAFLIPLIERLLRLEDPVKKHHVGAIIISPTRELATQIHSVLLSIISFHGPSTALLKQNNVDDGSIQRVDSESRASIRERTIKPQLLLGGTTSPSEDLAYFLKNSPNLLIATPGRLNELLSSPHVHCPQSSFEALILDEADRLLDLGFKDDLQKILGRLPKQRRTGLFSASVSEAVGEIIRVGLRNPVKIAVKVKGIAGGEDRRTPASLQMSYILVPPKQRFAAVARLLESLYSVPQKSIIYLSTCAAVDYFQYILPAILPPANDVAFHLIPLHGKHPAHVRIKNFSEFVNSQKPAILLTTDVAARGLDIPQVDLVVQVDPPSDPKVFLHRCGRAGRAGRKGLSVVFLQPGAEAGYIPFLDIRKTPVTPLAGLRIDAEDERGIVATKTMQGIVLGDRALHDKAQRAFVSWVQAYRKHQASSIFQLRDLDWEALGYGWGLLRLPKMPELKHWKGDRHLGNSIDMAAYAYKDKAREKVRLRQLSEGEARPSPRVVTPKHAEKNAWSDKVEQKRLRELRREKKRARREVERLSKMNPEEREQEAQMMELVEEVKRRNIHNEEPFNGFDD